MGLLEGDVQLSLVVLDLIMLKCVYGGGDKNLRENVIMLLLIQEVLNGIVKRECKAQYVTWIAIKKI